MNTYKLIRTNFFFAPLVSVCFLSAGCHGKHPAMVAKDSAGFVFILPELPVMLDNPTDRAAFLALHFWDKTNLTDTALLHHSEVLEQAFVDFLDVLTHTTPETACASIRTVLEHCNPNPAVRAYMLELFEKYLYDPNSPMRNEEYYIPVLEFIIASKDIPEIEKMRPNYRLRMVNLNRVGSVAANFTFASEGGGYHRMQGISSDYLLIYFYDPDCSDYKRVRVSMGKSEVLNRLQDKKHLKILAISIQKDALEWKRCVKTLPGKWLNGYNAFIQKDSLYELRAIPSLYLLDKYKRVLLKDAALPQVEEKLDANYKR